MNECEASADWQQTVYIFSGDQGEGKTSFLMRVLADLESAGVRVRGIAAPGHLRDGFRSGFSVLDLVTGTSRELCSVTPSSNCERHGMYYFRSEGLSFGCRALSPAMPGTADLFVVDEVGRFELKGAVWAGCIDLLVGKSHPPMIWTVRRFLVDAVAERWPETRQVVVEIGSASYAAVARDIMETVRAYRSVVGGGAP
ncbi:MAG: nucleoside-triphosphatase [Methanofollis sp.]|nr:nucleoside-triphosphatase [Methanofollis sp.]